MKSDGAVAAVKDRLNIADVVGRYVELRHVGGRLVGVCPFHHETKGSFNVHPEKGFYHCFGCQASGDVIDFYCRINGLEFREGLERLAVEAGVRLEGFRADPQADAKKQVREACLRMHEEAEAWFRARLAGGEGARCGEYVARRGMSPEVIERFGLGYSPDDWHGLEGHLKRKGFSADQAALAGLLVSGEKGTWDRFRDRLMFPIRDVSGRVVAFGGRALGDGDPKYLNSAETPIYTKGQHLYGLFQARTSMARTRRGLLTEGYVDVITLHQFGYADACGVLGTALTSEQVKRLLGFVTRVDLLFDGDGAGRKAAFRSAEMMTLQGASCRVALLPEGEDVDSLLHGAGTGALEDCLKRAVDGLAYMLSVVRETFSPREMADWAREFLGKVRGEELRAVYIPRLAAGLAMSEPELRRSLARAAESGGTRSGPARGQGPPSARKGPYLSGREAELLAFAARHERYRRPMAEAGVAEHLVSEEARALWDKLLAADGGEILSGLSEPEKRFFVEAQLNGPAEADEIEALWAGIWDFLEASRRKTAAGDIRQAVRRAQALGDSVEADRLLARLSTVLGRMDEQS